MKSLNVAEFENEITEDVCLVDFYADWCGPCKAVMPVLEELEQEGIDIYKINVDENSEAAQKLGVRNIPTIVVMANRQPVDVLVGAKTIDDYREALNKAKQAIEKENGTTDLG